MQDLRLTGKPAASLTTVDSIVSHIVTGARPGDVGGVFNDGGFGNTHNRLLTQLAQRAEEAWDEHQTSNFPIPLLIERSLPTSRAAHR